MMILIMLITVMTARRITDVENVVQSGSFFVTVRCDRIVDHDRDCRDHDRDNVIMVLVTVVVIWITKETRFSSRSGMTRALPSEPIRDLK